DGDVKRKNCINEVNKRRHYCCCSRELLLVVNLIYQLFNITTRI
ncbi:MAG: hypothetical protein ACI9N9_000576, partial [Enterobacterales bacterium]